jgi:hypothetical protein
VKMPIDIPPAKKALGIAVVAVVAVAIFEGVGVGAHARDFVGAVTSQIKTFFGKLLSGN